MYPPIDSFKQLLMEPLFMRFRPLLFMTLLLLYSCPPLAEESLFVGLPRSASEEVMSLVDGTGEEARFEAIRQLETDSKGNLYVYDVGKEIATRSSNDDIYTHSSIRRITPEGVVITLLGQGVGQELIGVNNGFAIRDDVLYTASAGCLLKADLSQPVIAFEVFYGQCLSATDLARLIQQAKEQGYPIPIEDSFWEVSFQPIQPNQEVYFIAREIPNGRNIDFKITKQETVINVFNPGRYFVPQYIFGKYVVDSQRWLYYVVTGEPGPGPAGPSVLIRTQFIQPFENTKGSDSIYEKYFKSPGITALDTQDYLYVINDGFLQRVKHPGKPLKIADFRSFLSQKIPIWSRVIDPFDKYYYFCTGTAVYKISLPQHMENSVLVGR